MMMFPKPRAGPPASNWPLEQKERGVSTGNNSNKQQGPRAVPRCAPFDARDDGARSPHAGLAREAQVLPFQTYASSASSWEGIEVRSGI